MCSAPSNTLSRGSTVLRDETLEIENGRQTRSLTAECASWRLGLRYLLGEQQQMLRKGKNDLFFNHHLQQQILSIIIIQDRAYCRHTNGLDLKWNGLALAFINQIMWGTRTRSKRGTFFVMVKKERKVPWPSTKEEHMERSKEILKGTKLPHVKKKILMQLACKRGAKCIIKSSNVQKPGSVIQA